MMERKMIAMIVDTLPVFYYEKMVGYMPSSFADLVFVVISSLDGVMASRVEQPINGFLATKMFE